MPTVFESFTDKRQRQELQQEHSARLTSTFVDKFEVVEVVFATANQDVDIVHELAPNNPEEVGYIVARNNAAAVIYQDTTPSRKAWTQSHIFLRASATCRATLLLFLTVPPLTVR